MSATSPVSPSPQPPTTHGQIMLVTGLSGAGKSTVLRALEDLGWETVDNLPLRLLRPLLATPNGANEGDATRPLAIGVDSRTRGFSADAIVRAIKQLRDNAGIPLATLFVDCAGSELERRYSETRRRHPLAEDRPASDGIAREREMLDPLRRWSDQIIDSTGFTTNDLQQEVRRRFGDDERANMVVSVMSFGFARGLPRNADLVFDVRFLRNPHWVAELREGTGLDGDVAAHVMGDAAYHPAMEQIEALLTTLLPRYAAEGKSYLVVAVGCTGGRHRSVHVAERLAAHLRTLGQSPAIVHRDLRAKAQESLEGRRPNG